MTIDERLEYLVKFTESLHESVQQLYEIVSKQAAMTELHERNWELTRRTLRAALAEFLRDDRAL